ncbi:hypothetical protein C2L96_03335 [Bacillus cereus]|nr:hypothetical protein C2L96_03335 [Bacillus cereus]
MEAARPEQEGIGAPDKEAICASQEKAKPPNILTAGARFNKKWKRLVQNRRALELLTKRRFLPRRKARNDRLF